MMGGMNQPTSSLETRTIAAAAADPVCAAILDRMPHLGLSEWWLTAGAVFQNVWNAVEGHAPGYGIKDYDVFYFDDTDLSWEAEDAVIRRAADLFHDVPAHVELRNWPASTSGTRPSSARLQRPSPVPRTPSTPSPQPRAASASHRRQRTVRPGRRSTRPSASTTSSRCTCAPTDASHPKACMTPRSPITADVGPP